MSDKKKLEAAIDGIEKQFGKGTIMRLGKKSIEPIEVISTGSLALDDALGIGGWPRGRIVELYGPESCIPADTYVSSELGLLTVAEVFSYLEKKATCVNRAEECHLKFVNREGEMEESSACLWMGRRPTWEIKTKDGCSVRSTANHRHQVLDEAGFLSWKRTSEITAGTYMVRSQHLTFGQETFDPDIAYFIGVLVADGYLGESRIAVTNDDPVIIEVLNKVGPALIGVLPKVYQRNNSYDHQFNSTKGIEKLYEEFQLAPERSAGKTVPLPFRRGDRETVKNFLQGYVDCEGSCDEAGIEVTSASHELAFQVKLLLQAFGVHASLNPKTAIGYEDHTYWRLNISGVDAARYLEQVGTRSRDWKIQATSSNYNGKTFPPQVVPLIRSLYDDSETNREHSNAFSDLFLGKTRSSGALAHALDHLKWGNEPLRVHLRSLCDYEFAEVIGISECPAEPVFDFTMPTTHSFVANGYITHNSGKSTMALHAVAEAQKLGGTAAYVDAEHALDLSYAQAIGVDTESMLLSQPDSGEQALEIVDALVRSEEVSIIVIDSVAALVPKAELEGEMGATHVGLQARLMSQALRKLTAIVAKSGTLIIFINQIRMRVAVMFGSPETTSGGQALKFYASIRLDVRRIGASGEKAKPKMGEEAIKQDKAHSMGNRTKVKVVKNKCSPPFREVEFDVAFGKGIDREAELVDLAAECNLLDRSGAWYSLRGERIGQGRESAKEFFRTHCDIAEALREEVSVALKSGLKAKPVAAKE
jgi:recombination protein RecA